MARWGAMSSLSKPRMDARQGCWRAFGHFALAACIPLAAGLVCYELNVGIGWLWLATWPLLGAGIVAIFFLEFSDVLNEKNTLGKAVIDFFTKCLGWSVGLASWLWWWF